MRTLSAYLDSAQRNVELLRAECASLRAQLDGKERSLEDATLENQRLCRHLSDGELADRKQHKVDKLSAQVRHVVPSPWTPVMAVGSLSRYPFMSKGRQQKVERISKRGSPEHANEPLSLTRPV